MATVLTRSFLPGEKVAVFPRVGGGSLLAGTAPLTKVEKVPSNGELVFKGLKEGQLVFVAREDGSSAVSMVAKAEAQQAPKQSQAEIDQALTGTRPVQDQRTVVTGSRSTASRGAQGQPFVNPESGSPTPSDLTDLIDAGHPRQEDYREVPQRSATVTGRAEPVAGAPQPEGVPQSDARNVAQASATELGVAVPRDPEQDPAERARQEDAPKGLEQRVVGETGEQSPVDKPPARTAGASKGSGQVVSINSAGSRTQQRSRTSAPNQSGQARQKDSSTPGRAKAKEGDAAKAAAPKKTNGGGSRGKKG